MGLLSLFKRKPQNQDAGLLDLAMMLAGDDDNPTYKRELLSPAKLDFSLESLRHVDEYLEALHKEPPTDQDLMRAVLRCGAYVGEVIRRNSKVEYHWLDFNEAARQSKLVKDFGMSLGTAGVLAEGPERMCFPLGKICKYIENGSEDSVYFFARMALEQLPELP
jgi:hypothetical protein